MLCQYREKLSKKELIQHMKKVYVDYQMMQQMCNPQIDVWTEFFKYHEKKEVELWMANVNLRQCQMETIKECNKLLQLSIPSNTEIKFMKESEFQSFKKSIQTQYDDKIKQLTNPKTNNLAN